MCLSLRQPWAVLGVWFVCLLPFVLPSVSTLVVMDAISTGVACNFVTGASADQLLSSLLIGAVVLLLLPSLHRRWIG